MADAILDLAIRSSLLLAAGGAVAFALRRRAASVQSLVLSATLAASLAMPAAIALLPSIDFAVLPVTAAPQTSVERSRPAAAIATPHTTPTLAVAVPDSSTDERTAQPLAAAVPASLLDSLPGALALVWLAGTVMLAVRLALSHRQLARLVARAEAAPQRWTRLADDVRRELGVRRAAPVTMSTDVSLPIAAGLLAPVVVLPRDADEWPDEVARDVLRHELAHVGRRDVAARAVEQLACAAYWFNPLVWMLAARAALQRERACDDAVLAAGTRAGDYASRLLALVRQPGARLPSAALGMASSSRIGDRIARVLDPAVRRNRPGHGLRAGLAVVASSAVLALAVVEPVVRAAVVEAPQATPAAAPAPQPADALCPGRIDSSSQNRNENAGVRRWRIELEGDRCDIDLRIDGRVEFNDSFTDIARLDANGAFRLDATVDGVRRELELRSRNGALERVYRVNGQTTAWDAEAAQWFARFLVALDRRTAIGVDIRLPHLLRQGGVAAVLAETGLMGGDHARTTYYEALFDARQLSSAERRQLIEQAARLTDSDHYANTTVELVVRQGRLEDAAERDAVLAMIGRMDSDHYRTESIEALGNAPLSAAQATAILSVLGRMESDHYANEVLTWLAATAPADLDMTPVADVIRNMESDHYQAESVKAYARKLLPARAATLMSVVADMESAHYQSEVLGELLRVQLTAADLERIVTLVDGMDSDHYQAEVLEDVLANGGADDRVRAAARRTASSLSSHYREQVLRRIGG